MSPATFSLAALPLLIATDSPRRNRRRPRVAHLSSAWRRHRQDDRVVVRSPDWW